MTSQSTGVSLLSATWYIFRRSDYICLIARSPYNQAYPPGSGVNTGAFFVFFFFVPPSACGARLNFYHEKGSAVPFPDQRCYNTTDDLLTHKLVEHFLPSTANYVADCPPHIGVRIHDSSNPVLNYVVWTLCPCTTWQRSNRAARAGCTLVCGVSSSFGTLLYLENPDEAVRRRTEKI